MEEMFYQYQKAHLKEMKEMVKRNKKRLFRELITV